MKTQEITFSNADLASLHSLIGEKWWLVTGRQLAEAPGVTLSAGEMLSVATANAVLGIRVEESPAEFEGWPDEYPRLQVVDGIGEVDEAIAEGRACSQHQSETVAAVLVVREEITRLVNDEPVWKYVTDYGVVFELETGAVAVHKASHRSTVGIRAIIADSVEAIEIPVRSIEWDWVTNSPEAYEVSRELIPVQDLIR